MHKVKEKGLEFKETVELTGFLNWLLKFIVHSQAVKN